MLKDSDPRLYEREKDRTCGNLIKEDDLLIEVKVTDNAQDILLVTKYGQCIRFNEKDVRSTGRVSMGVRGMNLSDNDEIIGMQMSSQGKDMLIVSEKVWENVQAWKNSQNKIAAEKA